MGKRIGNLEFRWSKTLGRETTFYPEIVCWKKWDSIEESCYTLLYWKRDSEGWYVQFVGSRPFEDDEWDHDMLWALMRYGQSIADAEFKIEERMKYAS